MTHIPNVIQSHYLDGPEAALDDYLLKYAEQPCDEYAHLIAISYAQQRHFDKALSFIAKVTNPTAMTLTAHANILQNLKDHAQALKLLKQAQQLEPHNAHTYNATGNIMMSLKKYESATENFSMATQLAPRIADYHCNLGIAYLAQFECDSAINAFQKAIEYNPKLIKSWLQIGLCFEQKHAIDAAQNAYKKALSLEPQHIDALHGMGRCYMSQQEWGKGVECINNAIGHGLDDIEAHHNLAVAYSMMRLYQNALRHWHFILERRKSSEICYEIGVCYQNIQKYDLAKEYFRLVIKDKPNHIDTYLNLAAIALDQFDRKTALTLYRKVLSLEPNHTDAAFVSAALSGEQFRHQRAPSEYVEHLFDQYAQNYEEHLVKVLQYQVPHQIRTILSEYPDSHFHKSIDIGCGTGIIGEIVKPHTRELVGIDVSKKMIEVCQKKKIYDRLIHGDILTNDNILNINGTYNTYDLITACDVLPYFGELERLVSLLANILNRGGILICTHENSDCDKFSLHEHVRYSHNPNYVQGIAKSCGLRIIQSFQCNIRQQQKRDVSGTITIMSKQS